MLLSYRVPREPSAPRIALWRKLKRLGVAQLLDGLVALPLDSRNREQLEWLADEVEEAGGDAMIWIGELGSAAQERELAGRMATAVNEDYLRVIADAIGARSPKKAFRSVPGAIDRCIRQRSALSYRALALFLRAGDLMNSSGHATNEGGRV